MGKSSAIKEDGPVGLAINEIEALMRKHGITIQGDRLQLVSKDIPNAEFYIGRDSCEFPRHIDEPIWRPRD